MTPAPGAGTRVVPGTRLAPLVALIVPIYLVLGPLGHLAWVWLLPLAVGFALEARGLARARPLCTRKVAPRLPLGEAQPVALVLENPARTTLSVSVRDDIPPTLTPDVREVATRLPAGGRVRLAYRVVPERRGRHSFGALHLRVRGPLGLCERLWIVPADEDVHVYPNARSTRRYALAAHLGNLRSIGIYAHRRAGAGGEFEHLREYVPGDPYRDIDWKGTAKRLRPVVRVHGDERSQTVMVAVDVGRMMATALSERGSPVLTKLDHAIQASLLLTHVALRAGDRVGLLLFSDDVRVFVPPMRGPSQYRRVLDAIHDAQASATYVDFRRFADFVLRRVTRRCLLVIFSDLLDESQAGPICQQVGRLRRKHLPLCVTMEDPVPRRLSERSPASEQEAFQRAAAADLLVEREAITLRLGKAGVGLLEAPAGELAIASVNRYLDIKQRHAL